MFPTTITFLLGFAYYPDSAPFRSVLFFERKTIIIFYFLFFSYSEAGKGPELTETKLLPHSSLVSRA